MAIERDADKVCASFLLERELFEGGWTREFEGEVSGVVGAGAFVRFAGELADVYEGFLPAREWGGREYFQLDESETALVGRGSGRRLRIGDPVTVRVNSIEAPRGRVDLLPAGRSAEERSPTSKGGGKQGKATRRKPKARGKPNRTRSGGRRRAGKP
jgi:ribonuclease R